MSWTVKNKVLVPVDFSEITFSALKVAEDFTVKNEDIHVIHVVREVNPAVMGGYLGKECTDNRPQVCEQILREKINSEFPNVRIHVDCGEPGSMIASYAGDIQAELIIMTSFGRRGLKEHMIGSVTERTLRLAKCPVLVLKP
jgi:nucleotide-binding universal stress UspA family protein